MLPTALLLTALAALAPSPPPTVEWANPARDRVVLRAHPDAHAPAHALAYFGETLRITATVRTSTGVWQLVSDDGRAGWLERADVRPAAAPTYRQPSCVSFAIGSHTHGRLACGRLLPAQGSGFRTWDFPRSQSPSRRQRRWGTSKLIERIRSVAREWQASHPLGPRLLVGDLSRPRGGPFGPRYGGIGHASHQNGLDVDIYYPRADGAEREAFRPSQVDRPAARELLTLVARSRPSVVFVGCRVGLPAGGRARHLCSAHENHLHARYRP